MDVLSYLPHPDEPREWRQQMLVESAERLLRIYQEVKQRIAYEPAWNDVAQVTLEVIVERKLAHMLPQ